MTRITIIDGHPDGAPRRFVHALASAYAEAADEAGHEIRRIGLAELEFPFLQSAEDWLDGRPCKEIRDAQADILWADHVVVV